MSDPLSLVKKAVGAGETLEIKDGAYSLGVYKLPIETKTAFKRSVKAEDYYYTLKEIIMCYQNAGLSFSEYRRNCVQEKVRGLLEIDRTALLSYLNGEVESCVQIDQQVIDSYVPPQQVVERSKTSSSSRHSKPTSEKPESQSRTKRKAEEMTASDSNAAPADGAVVDQSLEADKEALAKIRSRFFPALATKTAVYNSSNTEFSSVLKIFNDTILRPAQLQKAGGEAPSQADSTSTATAAATAATAAPAVSSSGANVEPTETSNRSVRPIIVVPTALTSVINMYNAKMFLEEGKFVRAEEVMKAGGEKKKLDVVFRRMAGDRIVAYKLIDDPTSLPPADWERVAAVFVTGQAWQFNRWKHSDPVDLFQHVLATHLTLEGRPVDSKVLSWNCKVLKIDEFKDYTSAGAASQFWLHLDDFILRHKPHLSSKSS